MHRHTARPQLTETRPYDGAVRHPENSAAHGNVCYVDTCSCGAIRRTNLNGQHVERGPWVEIERPEMEWA